MKLPLLSATLLFCSCSPAVVKYVDPEFLRNTSKIDTAKVSLYVVSDSIIPTGSKYKRGTDDIPKVPIRTERVLRVFRDSLDKYRFADVKQVSTEAPNLSNVKYDFEDLPFSVRYVIASDSSYSFSVNFTGVGYNPTDTIGKNWVIERQGNFVSLDYTYVLNRGRKILKAGKARTTLERFCFGACVNIDSLYNRLVLDAPKDLRNIAFSKEPFGVVIKNLETSEPTR